MLVVAIDGTIRFANGRAASLFGYRPDELVGAEVERLVPESVREAHVAHRGAYAREPRVRPMGLGLELTAIRKDGGEVPVEISLSPFEWNGERLVLSGIRDLSEHREVMEVLRLSEERFRRIAENAPDVLYRARVRPDSALEYVSPAVRDVMGFEPHECTDPGFLARIVHPEDRSLLRAVGSSRERTAVVVRLQRKGGGFAWLETHSVPVLDEAGEVAGVEGVARDVTERMLAEQLVRESEERLRLAVGTGRMIVWARDLATDEIGWDGEQSSWLMGEVGSDVTMPFSDFRGLVHPGDLDLFDQRVADRAEGKAGEFEFRIRGADGAYRWVTSRGALLRDESGEPIRVVGVWVDTTPQKEAEIALRARAGQQEAIVELGRAALVGLPLDELARQAVETVARTLDVEYAKVLELLPGEQELLLAAGVGWRDGLVGTATVPAGRSSQAGYTLLQDGPVVVEDRASELRFSAPPLLVEHGVVSGISVVIPGPERPFGVLGAHTQAPRRFIEDDATFLQAIAHVLAEAIQRTRAEDDLRTSLERLQQLDGERRRLLDHLVRAQEEERRLIAADIHDDAVQVVTALVLRLDLLRDRLEDPDLREAWEEAAATVRAALGRLRHLMFKLVPPALESDGLAPALRVYLERLRVDRGLEYDVDNRLLAEPDRDSRTVLYRISQEALTNVVKHAGATRVDVRLETSNGGTLVRIADDGRGFSPENAAAALGHLGLSSMRERAELAGGWWKISSEPGSGTTVEFLVPSAGVENES